MIKSFNKLLKVATGEEITYITIVNQFNCQLKQLRIDNKNKVIVIGSFKWNENITTRTNFNLLMSVLEDRNYHILQK